MKIGDRVSTEDGPGVIVDVEEYSRLKKSRYAVQLDNPPRYDWENPVYYWKEELKKV